MHGLGEVQPTKHQQDLRKSPFGLTHRQAKGRVRLKVHRSLCTDGGTLSPLAFLRRRNTLGTATAG